MARPTKQGLDYFPLDVDMDQDDKVALIEASHGLKGFGIIVKMLMKVYDNGYFYQWTEKEQLLFSKRVNVDINEVNVVINDCLKWGLFSKTMYDTHKILTSKGIQQRYLEATNRRRKVKIPSNYLLLDQETVNAYKNLVIVDNNPSSSEVNAELSTQSKVEESKVKESKVVEQKKTSTASVNPFEFYSNNYGMLTPTTTDSINYWIDDLGDNGEALVVEAMTRAVKDGKKFRYAEGILDSWLRNNVRSLEDVKAQDLEFKRQNKKEEPEDDGYEYGF